jgi:hypothetical protein
LDAIDYTREQFLYSGRARLFSNDPGIKVQIESDGGQMVADADLREALTAYVDATRQRLVEMMLLRMDANQAGQ